MKIGIIIGSLGLGGAERVTVNLSEWWTERGHSVSIYTTMKKPKNEYGISNEIRRFECFDASGKFAIIKKLRKILSTDQPDIVLVMDTPMCVVAVPALLGLKIPFVVSERSAPGTTAIKTATKLLSHTLMRFADGFVFQTNDAKNYYSTAIQAKSIIIPNPLLSDRLPEVFLGERDKKVVAVGRLIPAKNYPLLFEAFSLFSKNHTDFRLEIYGEGVLHETLQRQIDTNYADCNITLMGASDDVLDRIKDAAIFVLSSKIEGMPNALIEAMALGIPSISTDCPSGGPKDLIVPDENGILVPNDNASALAEAMQRLADHAELSHRLGKNAVQIRQKLDINVTGQAWLDFFNKAITRGKSNA